MKSNLKVLFPSLISLILYGLSLAFPAFEFLHSRGPRIEVWPGWQVLFMGWLGIFFYQVGWYANPLYIISIGLWWGRVWKGVAVLGTIAIVLGLNTFFLFYQRVYADGAGATLQLQSLKIGFYFWIVSISIPALWSCRQLWLASKP
uniref:Uncharacterized protein n=1 Tax=Cyanothece sp. (strain PCC 7425 / ATCC 29141) TaxID=395961 RepID=B8HZP2_CYAP4